MVNGRNSQQRWDGGVRLVQVAVAQNNVVYTLVYTGFGLMAQVVKRLAQAFLTFCHLKHDRQLLGVKALIADVTKYIKLCVGQNRLWQAHHLTVRCIGRQDIRSHGADVLRQAHHQFLADGVDGRVGNLRKLLTEVVEQHLWTVADDCQWCIVTHRGYWLLSCCGHWHDGFVDILLTEAEGHQLALQVAHAIVHLTSALQLLQLYAVFVQPLAIRMGFGQLLLYLAVVVYFTFLGINQQNLTWLQSALRYNIAWLEIHYANLTGYHHHTALCNGITAWAQTISVEHTASIATIAEQQCSRTVPRLHQDRVILVECLQILADRILVVKALWYQNGHRLRQ